MDNRYDLIEAGKVILANAWGGKIRSWLNNELLSAGYHCDSQRDGENITWTWTDRHYDYNELVVEVIAEYKQDSLSEARFFLQTLEDWDIQIVRHKRPAESRPSSRDWYDRTDLGHWQSDDACW